uniref:Riparin-2.1 n=1 Tax=Crinia riparia TaxID=446489 RepID=RIP21_CRIRI|nr:RecName: Full=Riparin-2.1 [Crinia riparia]
IIEKLVNTALGLLSGL